VAIAGPAVAAPTIAAAAPASFPSAMAHGTNGRCKLTATIPVGNGPSGVAANPKTNTIYVPNGNINDVSVISGRTNTVTAASR
jgi:DNA-binding beta-propeller fold protein YncE